MKISAIMFLYNSFLTVQNTSLVTGNIYEFILLSLLLLLVFVVLFVSVVLYRAFRSVLKITAPQTLLEEIKVKNEDPSRWLIAWNTFMGLRPIEQEKDMMIDHEYDGIQELDNPIPLWFNLLFYGTIVFSVIYLMAFHVFSWGPSQEEEYDREMARAEKEIAAYLALSANNIDEKTVVVDLDPLVVNAGQALFVQNCAVCHGNDGGGGIGPNLADDYWIHGGEIKDIFKVIKYGVLEKGMIAWEQSLSPAQIAELSNYIVSLRGTTPTDPKGPEGIEVTYEALGVDTEASESIGGGELL